MQKRPSGDAPGRFRDIEDQIYVGRSGEVSV
jgi:hypothetical protein